MIKTHRRVGGVVFAVQLALGITQTAVANEKPLVDKNIERSPSVLVLQSSNSLIESNTIDENMLAAENSIDLLQANVPSFSYRTHHSSDLLSSVRPFNLRGLSSDYSLVFINGKRRHKTSLVDLNSGGFNEGEQGSDISFIPDVALKKINIESGDSSAKYGSGAIAGAIHYILKDDDDGGSLSVRHNEYFEGDGGILTVDGNIGFSLLDDGFVNLSLETKQSDATNRSVQRPDANNLAEQGNKYISNPSQIWGKPEVNDEYTFFVNAAIDLGEGKNIYAFGNISQRESEGSLNYRNPQNYQNVFSTDSGETLLVGDAGELNGESRSCNVVTIPKNSDGSDGNVLASSSYLEMLENFNCFSFNSMYPGGYSPVYNTELSDSSVTVGSEGTLDKGFLEFLDGFYYDVSATVGKSESRFALSNSINPSLGLDSPSSFNLGNYIQSETAINVELSNDFDIGLTSKLLVSTGLEWRSDKFEVVAGDEESWIEGPYSAQGFITGADGKSGFHANSEGVNNRNNIALFADLQTNITEDFELSALLRYEDYTSFGGVTNYKIAGRYFISDTVFIRASHSVGHKAPSIAQETLVNYQSGMIENDLVNVVHYPAADPISLLKGAEELSPEKSTSYEVGLVVNYDSLFLSIDFYQMDLVDRIVKSQARTLSEEDWLAIADAEIDVEQESFEAITFFSNDYDTQSTGVDIAINYSLALLQGELSLSGVYNWNETEVENVKEDTTNFNIRRIEGGLPEQKASFTLMQSWEQISFFIRGNYFGEYFAVHNNLEAYSSQVSASTTFDLGITYQLNDSFSFFVGANNVFDTEAEKIESSEGNPNHFGAIYYETSPYDFNGGLYYLKAQYNF